MQETRPDPVRYTLTISTLVDCTSRGRDFDPKQSFGDMRLPRAFQVVAMTKNEVPDESGNYKNFVRRKSEKF
jgi:hypothetical protein